MLIIVNMKYKHLIQHIIFNHLINQLYSQLGISLSKFLEKEHKDMHNLNRQNLLHHLNHIQHKNLLSNNLNKIHFFHKAYQKDILKHMQTDTYMNTHNNLYIGLQYKFHKEKHTFSKLKYFQNYHQNKFKGIKKHMSHCKDINLMNKRNMKNMLNHMLNMEIGTKHNLYH